MKLCYIEVVWFLNILAGLFIHCIAADSDHGDRRTAFISRVNPQAVQDNVKESEEFRHQPPQIKPPFIDNNYNISFPSIPSFPTLPNIPGIPSIPSIPSSPSIPSIPKCPRNEEYQTCGPICEDECTKRCTGESGGCKKGCFCKNGYVRHTLGRCIPLTACPKPICPRYEEWKECSTAPYCDAKCGNYGGICEAKTECPGCFCRKGYYRHPVTNVCTYFHQCPPEIPQCPEGEQYSTCGLASGEQCQLIEKTVYREKCKPGCFCSGGNVRIDGKCVPKDQCPRICLPNEEYTTCGNVCQEYCSTVNRECNNLCSSGCFCTPGFKRIAGICLPESQCPVPKCAGSNEAYTECGKPCNEDCSATTKDCLYDVCQIGCFCTPGFKRLDGVCVPEEECAPPECPGPYEVYTFCGKACNEDCSKTKRECRKEKCTEGCFCLKGYKRIDGECVAENECSAPECSGSNEIYTSCGKVCNEDCSKTRQECQRENCSEGCFCANGYKRIDGECRPQRECPQEECQGSNEIYTSCGKSCNEDCSKTRQDCQRENCSEGCFCANGYKRIDGECRSQRECPQEECQGSNEIYTSCGKACNEDCSKTRQDCQRENCSAGCFCANGFKRIDGECRPQRECPQEECQGSNEIYTSCGKACNEDCSKTRQDCQRENCSEGCFCANGYKRIDGECRPQRECPQEECQGSNEIYTSCGKACNEDCSKTRHDCQRENCSAGCFCANGYKRIDGECRPQRECTQQECPGLNEIYTVCGKKCNEDCSIDPIVCSNFNCYPGCYCIDGYKRVNGTCVPENCLPPPCEPNETFLTCGRSCEEKCNGSVALCYQETCTSGCFCAFGFKRINGTCLSDTLCNCPENERLVLGSECTEKCFKTPEDCLDSPRSLRCTCIPGYKRIDGVCVSNNLCQCPLNEEYIYGNSCQELCESGPDDCQTRSCFKGCFCKKDYRRIGGQCVQDSYCSCGRNEEYTYGNECYEECFQDSASCRTVGTYKRCSCIEGYKRIFGFCVPDTECRCPLNEEMSYTNECYEQCGTDPVACSRQDTTRRCACVDGYVRINGTCVPESTCPCSMNEEYTLGNQCEEDCSATPEMCQDVDSFKRCSCLDRYKRINGVCVRQLNCTCGANEIYKYGNPCNENCDRTVFFCTNFPFYQGCFCREGYKRINGACVEYPNCQCEENEHFTYGNDCEESCNDTTACVDGIKYLRCTCLPFYKRINGICVGEENCQCAENEVHLSSNDCFDTCGTDPYDCAKLNRSSRCACADGFRRIDSTGECVPYTSCPCPENEINVVTNDCFEQCGTKPYDCAQLHTFPRCTCVPGYVRMGGVCVPDTNCPCGENEVYMSSSECIEQCGEDEDSCKDTIEWRRCTCADQFKRIDGVCVPDTECECPPNEHMNNGNECFETCGINPHECQSLPMLRKCFCNVGYVRVDGVCVEDTTCTCPLNEFYEYTNDCHEDCSKTHGECIEEFAYKHCGCVENSKRINGTCMPETSCSCPENSTYRRGNDCYETCESDANECAKLPTEERCVCNDGYVRINGNCVPDSECPCGDNEEYTFGNECIEDCSLFDCRNEDTYKRCTCLHDYKRIDGICVADINCPCATNEVYRYGSHCWEDCRSTAADCLNSECHKGCYCAEGFKRFGESCLAEEACSCDANEEYRCDWECNEDCAREDLTCLLEPCKPACFCQEGFRRIDGICQPDSECRCRSSLEEFKLGNRCQEDCTKTALDCVNEVNFSGCFCRNLNHRRISGTCRHVSGCRVLTDRALRLIDF